MLPIKEKILFGYLGAITAIIAALSLYGDPIQRKDRGPASTNTDDIESLYFFYFD